MASIHVFLLTINTKKNGRAHENVSLEYVHVAQKTMPVLHLTPNLCNGEVLQEAQGRRRLANCEASHRDGRLMERHHERLGVGEERLMETNKAATNLCMYVHVCRVCLVPKVKVIICNLCHQRVLFYVLFMENPWGISLIRGGTLPA